MFAGSSPITIISPSSKAHQKSGPFAPPALPSLHARTTLSDSRQSRRLEATLGPLPSHATGLPRLPEPPFRRAVPTTPADQAGADVDCSPLVQPSPNGRRVGIRIVTFEACIGFTLLRPAGSLSRLKRPLSRSSSPASYPAEPLVSYQINRQLSGWNLPRLMIRAFEVAPSRRTATHGHVVPVWGTYGMQMLLRGVTYSLSERVIAVPKAPKSGVYV